MTMMQERALFENEDWLVVESGLEHKRTGYFIDRDALAQRRGDGLWLWPMHVAEKSWCRMTPFMEAFSCAVSAFDLRVDIDLARSFMTARCEVADWPKASAATLRGGHSAPTSHEVVGPRAALPSLPRAHLARGPGRPAALSPWRTPRRIRRAGTTLVRLLQAAWNGK